MLLNQKSDFVIKPNGNCDAEVSAQTSWKTDSMCVFLFYAWLCKCVKSISAICIYLEGVSLTQELVKISAIVC